MTKPIHEHHPLTGYLHAQVASIVAKASPSIVLDMGGTGTMRSFMAGAQVVDANALDGVDALNLPYPDDTFDAAVSVATAEHVGHHGRFFSEGERVARKCVAHWFPAGPVAALCEEFKGTFTGYAHPCTLPTIAGLPAGYDRVECLTIAEYMLLLMTLYPQFKIQRTYDFIVAHGPSPYGWLFFRHL